MNKKVVMFLAAGLFLTGLNLWAEEAATPAPMDAATAAKMEAMKKLGAPNENHKALEPFVGSWNATVQWRMSPDSNTDKSQGTSYNHWILDDRFVQEVFKGTSMGQPLSGIGFLGYDNIRGEYTSVWLDNMSTGIMVSSGQYDAAEKTISKSGTVSCPMTGEKSRPVRSVCQVVDKDHYTLKMYMNDKDGKEFKAMEIEYERVVV